MSGLRPLKLFHQNICGLLCHIEPLEIVVDHELSDVICLSEHHLKQDEFDNLSV